MQNLNTIIQQYIIFPINIIQRLNLELYKKELTNVPNNEIENLQQNIKKEISVLQMNTKNLQEDYLNQMNYLHKITKNRIKWEEGIKAINEFTPNNIKEYVKNSINLPK